ncbi:pentatricopeptide repeat-containing protein At1g12775, mitochondrial-like [Papaver somniferum]|uniref:pentatricopeptide repeat-containing protein At1g12775, mitochondrial-like n=1 Tax=Papaver somniferum TaxID=3469 RepID=UPI000E70482A|nr:pentatricopeptide repeat-containing protein At1g12775, mitochondrial-like [Papaver somniferum]
MTKTGIKPNAVTCRPDNICPISGLVTSNILIHGLCTTGQVGPALKLKNNKLKWNVVPNVVVSYNAIIDTLCKGGLLDEALVLFSEMLHASNVVPNVGSSVGGGVAVVAAGVAFFAASASCGLAGLIEEEARRYFDEMVDRGISPDTVTFNVLIDSHCKDGKTEDAWGLFKLMEKINIKPNLITYNSMMDGLCLVGRLPDAVKLFDSMVDKGLEPDDFSWNILIDGYCKNRKLDGAMQLFKKMKQNGLKPTTVTYNILLRGLYQDGRMKTANNLFNEMLTMLDGYCKNGKIADAIELFESIETTGISINVRMYSILIHGLFQAGKLEDARKLFDKIPRNGLVPNEVTYTTMIKGFFRNNMLLVANSLVSEMEEKGCLRNARAYDTIIGGFLVAKENAKALHFLRKMLERKFAPSDSAIYLLVNTLPEHELKNL